MEKRKGKGSTFRALTFSLRKLRRKMPPQQFRASTSLDFRPPLFSISKSTPKQKYIHMNTIFFVLRVIPPAHPAPTFEPKCPNLAPTWHQHGANENPISSPNGPRRRQNRDKRALRWGQHGWKIENKTPAQEKKGGGVPQHRFIFPKSGQHVPNLEPKSKKWFKNLS